MSVAIEYASEARIPSFYEALDVVARERIYLEMVEAPPFDKAEAYQRQLIAKNAAIYYAVDNERVVGWCDIGPINNPRMAHRGILGMGLLPAYRGRGLGRELLSRALDHAQRIGLEKVELTVYTNNPSAIALYERAGFEREGLIRSFRKCDGRDFDCWMMAKHLVSPALTTSAP